MAGGTTMKRNKKSTNSYKIAHYLGLIFLIGMAICIVIWGLISRTQEQTIHSFVKQLPPCEQHVTNAISQMWAYNQELIPIKYTQMAHTYENETISTRTTGYCNDIAFTCRPGQHRSVCDPCAAGTGRQMALNAHIADTIKTTCTNDKK
jgi:hypothetical protein